MENMENIEQQHVADIVQQKLTCHQQLVDSPKVKVHDNACSAIQQQETRETQLHGQQKDGKNQLFKCDSGRHINSNVRQQQQHHVHRNLEMEGRKTLTISEHGRQNEVGQYFNMCPSVEQQNTQQQQMTWQQQRATPRSTINNVGQQLVDDGVTHANVADAHGHAHGHEHGHAHVEVDDVDVDDVDVQQLPLDANVDKQGHEVDAQSAQQQVQSAQQQHRHEVDLSLVVCDDVAPLMDDGHGKFEVGALNVGNNVQMLVDEDGIVHDEVKNEAQYKVFDEMPQRTHAHKVLDKMPQTNHRSKEAQLHSMQQLLLQSMFGNRNKGLKNGMEGTSDKNTRDMGYFNEVDNYPENWIDEDYGDCQLNCSGEYYYDEDESANEEENRNNIQTGTDIEIETTEDEEFGNIRSTAIHRHCETDEDIQLQPATGKRSRRRQIPPRKKITIQFK